MDVTRGTQADQDPAVWRSAAADVATSAAVDESSGLDGLSDADLLELIASGHPLQLLPGPATSAIDPVAPA